MTMKPMSTNTSPQSTFATRYYFDAKARSVAHGIKDGDRQAIITAARAMKRSIPNNRRITLVPIPSRKGFSTTTLLLAEEILNQCKGKDITVIDALRGNERQSLYDAKKQGNVNFGSSWFGFHLIKDIPKDTDLYFVDNVESTGATMKAAIEACGRGRGLVYAYDETHGRGISEVPNHSSKTTMTPKNHQEQKATDKHVELIAQALENAAKNDGILLNAERRPAPSLFPRGRRTGGFNSLVLGLHADQGGYKTGVYTLFNEAKKADVSIKQKQHGIPVMFTRWDSYANIKNPEVTVSKDEYKAMSEADQALYRPKPTRELRVLFNIDQTTMSSVKKEDYEAMVKEHGSLEQRGGLPVEDKSNRAKINQFILNVRDNLVAIQRDSTGVAHYDASKDKVLLPAQNRFENYEDYVQELLRQVVSSTGHQQRLARQGVEVPNGKAPEQDVINRERLVVELASAIKMQEMGMTARLTPESQALVPEWTKAMKENPYYLDNVALDVNSALDVIAKAERGEKVEYASVRNEQQTAELAEAIGQKGKIAIDNVQMMKDDNNRWTIYIKPEGQAAFNLYPERDDLNRFFTTIKNGPEEAIDKLRAELAQKYYAMGTNNPQLKLDLFGKDTPKADLDRIEKANIFRSKDGKLLIMPTIDGEKQKPRELTQAQWQRMWLADDMKAYKSVLAVNMFKDVLHPELEQKQGLEDNVAIHQVPEWAVPYIVNGDASGLSDEEQKIVDDFLDKNFPDGFVPEVNEENKVQFNVTPAFGTRNPNALPNKGESPFQAVSTVEMAFHPAGEMRVMTKEQSEEFDKQQQAEQDVAHGQKDEKAHTDYHQEEDKKNQETEKQKENEQEAKEKTKVLSPMLKQFMDLKKKHPDALLLFRCGDFYETYMQDAEKSSKILGITLTKSSKTKDPDGKPLAMAGFPYHALDTYLPKLIRAGQRVAICDQIEAPKQTTKRGISEMVTPGAEIEKASKAAPKPEQEETQSRGFHR